MQDKWVNNDGFDMSVFTPTKWVSYVFTGSLILITLVFLALYVLNGMTLLIGCSLICLAALVVSFRLIAKGPSIRFMMINYAEIAFFMVANVSFIGTDYGFQLYCFGFVASAMFMSLTAGNGGKVLWQSWLLIGLSLAYFLAVTLWFGVHEPLYSFGIPLLPKVVYALNAAATMGNIVLFTTLYMITAANLGQRLALVASHDELTQLLNRRGFYPIIEEAFESNGGQARSCYFAMLDIDHFKKINDRYGHKSGDAVLQRVSEVLIDCTHRWPGLQASRWGGEEFLLIYTLPSNGTAEKSTLGQMPKGAENSAARVFEELRASISNASVTVDETEVHCTATIGIADFAEGATADEALNLADKRLYKGKQTGRNRVVFKQ